MPVSQPGIIQPPQDNTAQMMAMMMNAMQARRQLKLQEKQLDALKLDQFRDDMLAQFSEEFKAYAGSPKLWAAENPEKAKVYFSLLADGDPARAQALAEAEFNRPATAPEAFWVSQQALARGEVEGRRGDSGAWEYPNGAAPQGRQRAEQFGERETHRIVTTPAGMPEGPVSIDTSPSGDGSAQRTAQRMSGAGGSVLDPGRVTQRLHLPINPLGGSPEGPTIGVPSRVYSEAADRQLPSLEQATAGVQPPRRMTPADIPNARIREWDLGTGVARNMGPSGQLVPQFPARTERVQPETSPDGRPSYEGGGSRFDLPGPGVSEGQFDRAMNQARGGVTPDTRSELTEGDVTTPGGVQTTSAADVPLAGTIAQAASGQATAREPTEAEKQFMAEFAKGQQLAADALEQIRLIANGDPGIEDVTPVERKLADTYNAELRKQVYRLRGDLSSEQKGRLRKSGVTPEMVNQTLTRLAQVPVEELDQVMMSLVPDEVKADRRATIIQKREDEKLAADLSHLSFMEKATVAQLKNADTNTKLAAYGMLVEQYMAQLEAMSQQEEDPTFKMLFDQFKADTGHLVSIMSGLKGGETLDGDRKKVFNDIWNRVSALGSLLGLSSTTDVETIVKTARRGLLGGETPLALGGGLQGAGGGLFTLLFGQRDKLIDSTERLYVGGGSSRPVDEKKQVDDVVKDY